MTCSSCVGNITWDLSSILRARFACGRRGIVFGGQQWDPHKARSCLGKFSHGPEQRERHLQQFTSKEQVAGLRI
ncbi:hypothetical protein V493_00566 [Pseudogymnoascus sp. VKM F-4281 (FW-2241)]|nr:hypothetical protein V493_00566 [Pseudogymnoascus sp. VKM F-4281 (FW-2241)]